MIDLVDAVAETLEAIALEARSALDAPWLKADSLRATLAEILSLATHAGVEADDLRLLADLSPEKDGFESEGKCAEEDHDV